MNGPISLTVFGCWAIIIKHSSPCGVDDDDDWSFIILRVGKRLGIDKLAGDRQRI